MKPRLALVVEQTLGHVAHTRNIEAAVAANPAIDARLIKIRFDHVPAGLRLLPGGRNWSLRASLMTRRALKACAAEGGLGGIFIHTQVASLLSTGLMSRYPTVISLDATPIDFDEVGFAYHHSRQPRLVEFAKLAVNRRALLCAAALVTWSRQAARTLSERYGVDPARVTVIRPGVDLARFRPAPARPHDGAFRVLFVGGDFARKGGHDLLEAMRRLPSTAELDIVTGSPPPVIPPGVRGRVHVGLAPGCDALLDLYRRADVFALPTLGDCFPQVLAEAAACGLPIVATDTGAIGEVVTPGRNGILVRPGSPAEIVSALGVLMSNARMRYSMGAESLRLAQAEHDAMRNNTRILEMVAGLARSDGGAAAPAGALVRG